MMAQKGIDLEMLKHFFQSPFQPDWESEAKKVWETILIENSEKKFCEIVTKDIRIIAIQFFMGCMRPEEIGEKGLQLGDKDPFPLDYEKQLDPIRYITKFFEVYLRWLDAHDLKDNFMQYAVAPRLEAIREHCVEPIKK